MTYHNIYAIITNILSILLCIICTNLIGKIDMTQFHNQYIAPYLVLCYTMKIICLLLLLQLLVFMTQNYIVRRKCNTITSDIYDFEIWHETKVLFIMDKFWKKGSHFANTFGKYVMDINNSSYFQCWLNNVIDENVKRIDICIESLGGNINSNDIIVHNLLNYDGEIHIHVPKNACSAACLIALNGTVIYVDHCSVLSPTDPIITINGETISVQALIKMKKKYTNSEKKETSIDDIIYAHIVDSEKLYRENNNILKRIFKKQKMSTSVTDGLLNIFGSGTLSHETPFTSKYLKTKGMNVKIEKTKLFDILSMIKKNDIFT